MGLLNSDERDQPASILGLTPPFPEERPCKDKRKSRNPRSIWLRGLEAAAISAAASAILSVLVNPGTFDIYSTAGWKNIASTVVPTVIIAVAAYLKKSPLPSDE